MRKKEHRSMFEYAGDMTVNYKDGEEDRSLENWYPSIDLLLVHVRSIVENEPKATSFVVNIVQRDHKP